MSSKESRIFVNYEGEPMPHVPPAIVKDGKDGTVYYSEVGHATKADAIAAAVVFTSDQVTDAWGESELSHLQLISTNKKFRALPKTNWDAILALHQTIHQYEEDFFDCDSFAAVFVGFTVWNFDINGVARVLDNSAHHSYNAVLISDDGKTCYWKKVEPQADIFAGEPPPGIKITVPAGAYKAASGFAITA